MQIWVASPDKMNGIFTSAGMVAQYEQLWHSDIFVPCLENLETEVCVHRCVHVLCPQVVSKHAVLS